MRKRTICESTARELSVKAGCDPRTIRKVLQGEEPKSMSAKRALAVLIEAGLIQTDRQVA